MPPEPIDGRTQQCHPHRSPSAPTGSPDAETCRIAIVCSTNFVTHTHSTVTLALQSAVLLLLSCHQDTGGFGCFGFFSFFCGGSGFLVSSSWCGRGGGPPDWSPASPSHKGNGAGGPGSAPLLEVIFSISVAAVAGSAPTCMHTSSLGLRCALSVEQLNIQDTKHAGPQTHDLK